MIDENYLREKSASLLRICRQKFLIILHAIKLNRLCLKFCAKSSTLPMAGFWLDPSFYYFKDRFVTKIMKRFVFLYVYRIVAENIFLI